MTEALPLSPSAVAEWVRPLYHFGVLHLPARKLAQLLANLGKNLIARMDEPDGDILGAFLILILLVILIFRLRVRVRLRVRARGGPIDGGNRILNSVTSYRHANDNPDSHAHHGGRQQTEKHREIHRTYELR